MALVGPCGVPVIQVGFPARSGHLSLANVSAFTADANTEAAHMIGQIATSDGLPHTIDTSGSSSIGWRAQGATWANAATRAVVGIAAVDLATGPPGRAVNTAGVVNFTVSRTLANAGELAGAGYGWQEHAPDTGSMTISPGDLVAIAVQMTVRGGTDALNVGMISQVSPYLGIPSVTQFTGSFGGTGGIPIAAITFRDGARGYVIGGLVQNGNITTVLYNSGSSPREYGQTFRLPYPARIAGAVSLYTPSGDVDIILYTDPFGTPVAQRTLRVAAAAAYVAAGSTFYHLFASPFDVMANQEFSIIVRPASASSITLYGIPLANNIHNEFFGAGPGVSISRTTGAFTGSGLTRQGLGVLISALNHPARSSYVLGL